MLLERYGSSIHWLVHLVGILPMPWCVDVAKVHLWRGFAWDRHDRFALASHQTHSKNASKSNTVNQSISSIHENITLYLLKMVAGPHGSGSCHKNRTPSFDLLHKTKSISQSQPIFHCLKLPRSLANYFFNITPFSQTLGDCSLYQAQGRWLGILLSKLDIYITGSRNFWRIFESKD